MRTQRYHGEMTRDGKMDGIQWSSNTPQESDFINEFCGVHILSIEQNSTYYKFEICLMESHPLFNIIALYEGMMTQLSPAHKNYRGIVTTTNNMICNNISQTLQKYLAK